MKHFYKTGLSLFSFLLLFAGCNAQNHDFEKITFEIKGFDWDSNPYKFSSFIIDSVLDIKGSQYAAWDYANIGNIKKVHETWDGSAGKPSSLSQQQIDSFLLFEKRDAIEYILDKAVNHQVIIINEAHHMPQHRVLTAQLLDGLKEIGFSHIGLETYFASQKNDSTLIADGYPKLTTGYYSKEPQFGNLIRLAHQNGFKLFGYESEGHTDSKGREINQAKNIQAYLHKFPNEKIIIHCGFDHGYEGELNNNWEKAMAGRLFEYTGIDPLTINQTSFSERSKKVMENPYYQLIDVTEQSVFINENEEVFGKYREGAWFDISVFHPRTDQHNRPSWLLYGARKMVDFIFEVADINGPFLVLAYKEGEEIGAAVPYDVQETSVKKVRLVLEPGNYEIVIWNQENKALKTLLKVN